MEITAPDHQESIQSNSDGAVYVQNAQKSYGIGKGRSNILQSLNMAVKQGTM